MLTRFNINNDNMRENNITLHSVYTIIIIPYELLHKILPLGNN